jgi:hypothetical protein
MFCAYVDKFLFLRNERAQGLEKFSQLSAILTDE